MDEKIVPFRRRGERKEEDEPVSPQPPIFQGSYDNPDDEQLSPEEERLIQGRIASLMASHGLDVRRYSVLVGNIKTLVAQVPPQRRKRLRNEFLGLVHGYSIHEAIDFLNRASDADISTKPMFYEALVLKIDNSRAELTRAMRKRMREDKVRRKPEGDV